MSHTRLCYAPPFFVVVEVKGGGLRPGQTVLERHNDPKKAFKAGRDAHHHLENEAPAGPSRYPSRKAKVLVTGRGEDGADYVLKAWHPVRV